MKHFGDKNAVHVVAFLEFCQCGLCGQLGDRYCIEKDTIQSIHMGSRCVHIRSATV